MDLDAGGLDDLLDRTSALIASYDARIRAGEIDIRPREPKVCDRCDFGDLCRYEAWMDVGMDVGTDAGKGAGA